MSPAFKVREFSITDVVPYPISLRWNSATEEGLRYDLWIHRLNIIAFHLNTTLHKVLQSLYPAVIFTWVSVNVTGVHPGVWPVGGF